MGGIYDQDIWYSRQKSNEWTVPIALQPLNNKLNNAIIGQFNDRSDSTKELLYLISSYGTERDFEKGISTATRKLTDTAWVVNGKLPIPGLDIDGKYVGYCMSQDQNVVIISYEGSDSEGEEDLYYSISQIYR
jgi:hypothetical protein